jgi:hypothetical protein
MEISTTSDQGVFAKAYGELTSIESNTAHTTGSAIALSSSSSTPQALSSSFSQSPPSLPSSTSPTVPLIRGSIRLLPGLSWTDEVGVLPSRVAKLQRLLESRNVDADVLREQAWSGAPARYRVAIWQMLLGYLPLNRDRQAESLARKKAEYQQFVDQFCGPRSSGAGMSDAEQVLLRQVLYDAKRTNPEIPLFHTDFVQRSLERVLFVYAQKHFATGYVQGINDLATPLYAVFLSPWADLDAKSLDHVDPKALLDIEADVYWCLARLVEGIQDHYTPSQPGIQKMIHKLRELVHRIDESLVVHLEAAGVEFHTFAFRWMNCLLLRELPLRLMIRLWDTYMAETHNNISDGFNTFHIFVCAMLLLKFSKQLKQMAFQDLVQFLKALPTKEWSVKDVEELLAQAHIYRTSFEGSPAALR